MSKLDNLVRSKGYKNFMSKLYGWGAAVVIVGALFKINHWPGGTVMLIIGMGVETIIFFLSAFEPPHVEWDWSLAYPELAGMKEGEGEAETDENGEVIEKPAVSKDPLTAQLDKMLEDAKISPDLIDRLGAGMQNLADSANSMNNMATATAASDKFVSNMDSAADAAGELAVSYRKTAEYINNDTHMSSAYSESLKDATNAVSNLANIYKETAATLTTGDVSYVEEMKKMSASLASINAMYEMQLQNSTDQINATKEIQERINGMIGNFADSAEGVLKYKEQVDALTRKVSELNNIYGNMLAAMQTRL